MVDSYTIVMLLLSGGGSGSGLCLGMLLAVTQTLQIGLRTSMLPGRLVMLVILLLMRIKMLSLKHCAGVRRDNEARCGLGIGSSAKRIQSALILG